MLVAILKIPPMNVKRLFLMAMATVLGCVAINAESTGYYQRHKSLLDILPTTSDDVIFVGNSIIDQCAWNELFQNNVAKNRGITGDNIKGVASRISTITSGHPAKIFLEVGINDVASGLSADEIASQYESLVATIKSATPSTQLYLFSLLPINNDFGRYKTLAGKESIIKALNERYKSIAQSHNATYIDLYSIFKDGSDKLNTTYTADGLHLNDEGYRVLRNAITSQVELTEDLGTTPAFQIQDGDIVIIGNDIAMECPWQEMTEIENIKCRRAGSVVCDNLLAEVQKASACHPERIIIQASYTGEDGSLDVASEMSKLKQCVEASRSNSPETEVIIMNLIPMNTTVAGHAAAAKSKSKVAALNAQLRLYGKQVDVNIIDAYLVTNDGTSQLKRSYTDDGFHLNNAGYNALAKKMQQRL